MKTFGCEHCESTIRFESSTCQVCSSMLGYVPAERTIRRLLPSTHEAGYRVAGDDTEYWRCLNAAWGCNWMLTASSGAMSDGVVFDLVYLPGERGLTGHLDGW